MNNHYRTLGIDPGADGAAIRSAYLELMRRHHPDRGGPEADPNRAQEITAAYEVLRNPERRVAYDRARVLSFGGSAGPVKPVKARGGHLARNLFLVVAAATVGLGYWGLQQPRPQPRSHLVLPSADVGKAAIERQVADAEVPVQPLSAEPPSPAPAPVAAIELPVEEPMILPPLPLVRPAPSPRSSRTKAPTAKTDAAFPPKTLQPTASAKPENIDLADLEHHLQLLTDQSVRFGSAAKRTRLFATRDAFVSRLGACATDLCRRDAYLRRNQEIADIMRD